MNFLSRIWRHEESRAVVMQILVIFAVFGSFGWLVSNLVTNFAALNKNFGFDFLSQPAGYDINQTLIEYTNRSSHFRAALVGLLNTFMVAIFGIVLATIMGVILGIIRLSNNWLARNVTYWYIEFTRNVPILLHILLWHGIIINTLPHPKKAMSIGDVSFLTNRGFYVPEPIAEVGISVLYLAIVAAVVFAVFFSRYAKKLQSETGRQLPVFWVNSGVIIIVPMIAFLAAGSPLTFEYPVLKGFNFKGGMHLLPEFVALTFALAIYTAAFIAENVRAGILAIHKGQREAAEALGLRPGRVMSLVILPQARRVIIPPLTSQYLNLTKNSSLAIAIGYMDLVATLGGITLNQTGREIETMLMVMGMYLAISLAISMGMNWYNSSVKLVDR